MAAKKKKRELPRFIKNALELGAPAPKGQPRVLEKARQQSRAAKAARGVVR